MTNEVSIQELLDCLDNDLGNNFGNNAWNLEHNAEKLQDILNRIMQRIMSIFTSALGLSLLCQHSIGYKFVRILRMFVSII